MRRGISLGRHELQPGAPHTVRRQMHGMWPDTLIVVGDATVLSVHVNLIEDEDDTTGKCTVVERCRSVASATYDVAGAPARASRALSCIEVVLIGRGTVQLVLAGVDATAD